MNEPFEFIQLSDKRSAPRKFDLFVMKTVFDHGAFRWGRVVNMGIKVGGFDKGNLIYVYKTTSPDLEIPHGRLFPADLILPPVAINNTPWARKYFKFVANEPPNCGEVLPVHCFEDYNGRYYNEWGEQTRKRTEPTGIFGLSSVNSLGAELRAVLG